MSESPSWAGRPWDAPGEAVSGAGESATCQQDRELRRFSEQRLLSLKQTRYSKKRRMPPMRHHMHTRTRTHHSAWTAAQTTSTLLSPPPKSGPSVHESPWHSLSPEHRQETGGAHSSRGSPHRRGLHGPRGKCQPGGAAVSRDRKQHEAAREGRPFLESRQRTWAGPSTEPSWQSRRLSPFQRSWHPS